MPEMFDSAETFAALYSVAEARLAERLGMIRHAFKTQREWGIPFNNTEAPDLITSCLTLQKATDSGAALKAIYTSLAEGGLFLGCLIGGQSFHELRSCLMEAEVALSGGARPRTQALPDPAHLSRQMTAAGFAHVVVDVERLTLVFDDLYALMHELRAAGCTNKHPDRPRTFTRRALFEEAKARYRPPTENASSIAATVDVVFLHGWREIPP